MPDVVASLHAAYIGQHVQFTQAGLGEADADRGGDREFFGAHSESPWIGCYEALVRAGLEHRAGPRSVGLSAVGGRVWPSVVAVDIPKALPANNATDTVTTGDVVGQHLDGAHDGLAGLSRSREPLEPLGTRLL